MTTGEIMVRTADSIQIILANLFRNRRSRSVDAFNMLTQQHGKPILAIRYKGKTESTDNIPNLLASMVYVVKPGDEEGINLFNQLQQMHSDRLKTHMLLTDIAMQVGELPVHWLISSNTSDNELNHYAGYMEKNPHAFKFLKRIKLLDQLAK